MNMTNIITKLKKSYVKKYRTLLKVCGILL